MSRETDKALLEPRRQELHAKYLKGSGLSIGSKGYHGAVGPELPNAIDIDLDYPGYDGKILPFDDNSVDFIYSSHTLEHIKDDYAAIKDWFRVIKPGGHLFIVVPHAYLYERKLVVLHGTCIGAHKYHSTWNADHWRAYTPTELIEAIECALEPNTYRLRHCADNDYKYNYDIPVDKHPSGAYELEVIIEKLVKRPIWKVE